MCAFLNFYFEFFVKRTVHILSGKAKELPIFFCDKELGPFHFFTFFCPMLPYGAAQNFFQLPDFGSLFLVEADGLESYPLNPKYGLYVP